MTFMKEVTLQIPSNKYPQFMEFAKTIKYIKVVDVKVEEKVEKVRSKTQILQGLKQAAKEVKLIRAGKLKGISARDLVNEL
jgi:hypothetical protein